MCTRARWVAAPRPRDGGSSVGGSACNPLRMRRSGLDLGPLPGRKLKVAAQTPARGLASCLIRPRNRYALGQPCHVVRLTPHYSQHPCDTRRAGRAVFKGLPSSKRGELAHPHFPAPGPGFNCECTSGGQISQPARRAGAQHSTAQHGRATAGIRRAAWRARRGRTGAASIRH